MTDHSPQPAKLKFFTPGAWILTAFAGVGLAYGLGRLLIGLGAVTNLDNSYPWGIWIAIDVACGVALAAGGFMTAAVVDIFGRKKYKALLRPAILTAWLGYFMVAVGLMFDLGRYWNVWRPLLNWQGNSVLFEVGLCVMAYLAVLTVEMSPALLEGLEGKIQEGGRAGRWLARLKKPVLVLHSWVKVILPIFIVAGVVLSCMHQSSLGTLMVLAPTKISALWYTPLLPVLFLLSAMMVGLPMVIIESLISSKSFHREPEVGLLGSLAKLIPWVIGLYAAFKIGDLALRWSELNFTEHPEATVAWAVEMAAGILAPLVLFSLKQVRRSAGWLLTASFLAVFGVVLNRLNVYIIGYFPPFTARRYFPSMGEIALTVGLACVLMLLYRFFAIQFPVLSGQARPSPAAAEKARTEDQPVLRPVWAWVFRGTAALFLLGFVSLYSIVHAQAIRTSLNADRSLQVVGVPRRPAIDTSAFKHAERPEAYRNLYILNSPLLNDRMDYYEPVRFTHRTHDVNSDSNCAVCHHRYAFGPDDRVGQDVEEMHADIEVRITGASCLSCHRDLTEKQYQKCSQCHSASNEPDYPGRIGLKGAYHRQCIGCHQGQPRTAKAPTDCVSCHHPLVPDHAVLLDDEGVADKPSLTEKCLVCHERTGQDILETAHWTWRGRTPEISGREHSTDLGLRNTIDNYDISLAANPRLAARFHIGLGPLDGDAQDPRKIDCLVCHGVPPRPVTAGGEPGSAAGSTAALVARPSRAHCGSCHFYAGGGPGIKSGDLSPALVNPPPEADYHMGQVDMRCQDCHTTSRHQIAGLSFNAPVLEERAGCESCHGVQPHGIAGVISRHLDNHVKSVACETCHIPLFARSHPTQLSVDFSKAGRERPGAESAAGMPSYDKRYGEMSWGRNLVPLYLWFDGNRKSYLLGDPIDPESTAELNRPLGDKHNALARIYPFKVHRAVQPYDKSKNILTAVRFEDAFWKDGDWGKAIDLGMRALGFPFSGEYGFVNTEMVTPVHHEVAPARESLGCADCHEPRNISCGRCHRDAAGMGQPAHAGRIYPRAAGRFDFKALGYVGDPAVTGGRFYMYIRRGRPMQ